MRNIGLFAEDFGHESFLTALLSRLAREHGIEVRIAPYNVRGGHGQVVEELKQYLRDLERGRTDWLDLLVVGTDANCRGLSQRKREILDVVENHPIQVVCAVPDPHIERWLLIDSAAFKRILGRGCNAPDQKCERHRYKDFLLTAVRDAGISPPLGGIEYAEDIANIMDWQSAKRQDVSLGALLDELHCKFTEWNQS